MVWVSTVELMSKSWAILVDDDAVDVDSVFDDSECQY